MANLLVTLLGLTGNLIKCSTFIFHSIFLLLYCILNYLFQQIDDPFFLASHEERPLFFSDGYN